MDREPLGLLLLLAGVPPLVALAGLGPGAPGRGSDATAWEAACWRRIWLPLLPLAAWLALLAGWGLTEPAAAEAPPMLLCWAGVGGAAWVIRAAARAVSAARRARSPSALAGATGLLRPRLYVSPVLRLALSPFELAAVLAHEEAHVRHRDPVRLWLAQLATDLQAPFPGATRRFEAWRCAMEFARDDEARRHGADGPALARALLVTARLQRGFPTESALTGDGALLVRFRRLLDPLEAPGLTRRAVGWPLLVLLGASAIGVVFGEPIVGGLLW